MEKTTILNKIIGDTVHKAPRNSLLIVSTQYFVHKINRAAIDRSTPVIPNPQSKDNKIFMV
jgi:hypothetical protein